KGGGSKSLATSPLDPRENSWEGETGVDIDPAEPGEVVAPLNPSSGRPKAGRVGMRKTECCCDSPVALCCTRSVVFGDPRLDIRDVYPTLSGGVLFFIRVVIYF